MQPLRRPLLTVLLVAAIARAVALGIGWDSLSEDPDAYTAIAHTLAASGVFGTGGADGPAVPTAFRPPLYPAILAGLSHASIAFSGGFADPLEENSLWRRAVVAVLHWSLGLLTAATTYLAARRLLVQSGHRDEPPLRWAACFAALLVIVDPILLQSSVRVMTETLATALAALALLLWSMLLQRLMQPPKTAETPTSSARSGYLVVAAALGSVLALAYLCRPTFIVWTALLCGCLLLTALRARDRRPFAAAAAIVLISAACVGGWTLRNQRHFGHPIWATTHGGYTLLLGNNPPFYQYLRSGRIGIAWDPEDFFERWQMRTLADPRQAGFWQPGRIVAPDPHWQLQQPDIGDEVAQDTLAYQTAVQSIQRDPGGFLRAGLWRLSRLVSPMPQRSGGPLGLAIIGVTGFYCVVLLLAAVGCAKLGRRLLHLPWAASLTLVLALVAVHTFYWTNLRMRAPAVPVLATLAAAALLKRPTGPQRPPAERTPVGSGEGIPGLQQSS